MEAATHNEAHAALDPHAAHCTAVGQVQADLELGGRCEGHRVCHGEIARAAAPRQHLVRVRVRVGVRGEGQG